MGNKPNNDSVGAQRAAPLSHTDAAPFINIEIQIASPYKDGVDIAPLIRLARAAVQSENSSQAELTLVITDDATIQDLNRTYRHVDAPTDVLAFAMTETDSDTSGTPFVTAPDSELESAPYLGDVIVSYPTAVRQAADAGHPIAAELALLTVHGVLHLLGYDHATPEEKSRMWQRQQELLEGGV